MGISLSRTESNFEATALSADSARVRQRRRSGRKFLIRHLQGGAGMGRSLKGSKSFENLKEAFAGESQANRRYLYFARRADIEGDSETAGLFRDTAEGETGHAFGHMDFLAAVGDPATDEPVGNSEKNLVSAVAGETYEFTAMYPGFAKTARDEGFDEIADWFSTLARAEKTHAGRFQKALDGLKGATAKA